MRGSVLAGDLGEIGDRVRRLEGRNDALGPREELEPGEGLGIGARDVRGATITVQRGVLRSDPGVV